MTTQTAPELNKIQSRTVGVLAGAQVLSGIAIAGSVAAGSLITAAVSGSEGMAGLAQTAGVVGAALLALPLARIALSRGRRAALSTGYGIGAVGAIVVVMGAVARSTPVVLLGCLLVGVASAAGYQARYAATDLASEHSRGRSLSLVVWAGTIGAILGPNLLQLAGSLGLWLSLPELTGPYLITFATLAGAVLLLVILLRPDPYVLATSLQQRAEAEPVQRPGVMAGMAHLRGNRGALLGMLAIALGHAVMVMVMVMTPIHMAHVDVTLQLIGLVISVHVAGMYALSPVVGWAVDRWGRVPVVWLGAGILLVSCVVSGSARGDDVPLLGVGLFLLGLGWSCTLIAGSTLIVDDVAPDERPSVQGLSDLVMNVAGAVGGAVAGVVVMLSSYAVLCAVAVVPVLALAVVTKLWGAHAQPVTPPTPSP